MRLTSGPTTGVAARMLLFFLLWLGARMPAVAAGFDCARAGLQIDFVICRSEGGRRAIADLTTAWDKVTAAATPDRKAALLDQERRWILAYSLICGLKGRGSPAPDPTLRTDKCVIEQLQERTAALQMIAISITTRGADDPEAFLNELYTPYKVGGSTVIVDGNVDLYFAPPLAKAFRGDQAGTRRTNSPPNLDGDPLINSQEQVRLSELEIRVAALDPTHARGVVGDRTSKISPPPAVTVDLIHTERGWRIANIYYPSTNGMPESSLAQILVGAAAAASTPDCAFHPTVKVDTQSAMKAGDWLPITWTRCSPTTRLDAPTFLVIAVPDEVRLRGVGFYALRPHARAPYGLDFETDRARIIIPLHQPLMPAMGTVEVSPILAGDLPIQAAVFRREGDRNVVLWRAKPMVKTVTPGPISVGVWQEISSEAPKEIRQSNDGRWELRIYKASYEVVDRRTGDLVIRRAGTKPAFSPTQRFLVAGTGDHYEEIVDLAARRVIRQRKRNFIVWLHEDSIALENWGRSCVVRAIETLVDGTTFDDPMVAGGALACDAWYGGQVDLSIDAGYIAQSSTKDGPDDAASLTRVPVAAPNVRIPWMQANFEKSYAGPPRIWRLHDSMKLVSLPEIESAYIDEAWRPYMMSASHVISDNGAVQVAGDLRLREPVTRGIAGGEGANSDSLETSLKRMLGTPPGPMVIAERAAVVPEPGVGFLTANPTAPAGVAETNVFGLPAIPLAANPLPPKADSCDYTGGASFVKAGDAVFEVPDIGKILSQVAYWPGSANDLVVLSVVSAGTEMGGETTRILRRQGDGRWLSDCRHKTAQPTQVDDFSGHEGEIPPMPFRFPSGDVALLYVVYHQLLLSPAVQNDPVCNLNGVREPETLQTVARLGSNLILLLNSTGDLDLFECPSGRHVISGALLDDELLVYTDQGWFDGSAEAASFVQVRLAGVRGRYPLAQFEAALRRPGILKDALDGKAEPPIAVGDPPYVRFGPDGKTVLAGDEKDLAALRFYDDGVMVEETPISGREGAARVPVDKLADARQAAVVAVNAAGIQSAALLLPSANSATSRKGRLIGLTVGIDSYKDPRIPQLHFAEHDAVALADALDRNDQAHREASVVSLTGASATASAILDAVRARVAEATSADTLVLGFAGHGVAEGGDLLLVMPDTDLARLEDTTLRWSALEKALAQSAARVVVFLDACHSGTAALGSGNQHEAAIDRLKNWKGPPMLIFAASKGREVAQETATAGGGLFTAALTEALRSRPEGGDSTPLLTLNELSTSVKRRVIADSQGAQIPWFGRRGLLGNFVLF